MADNNIVFLNDQKIRYLHVSLKKDRLSIDQVDSLVINNRDLEDSLSQLSTKYKLQKNQVCLCLTPDHFVHYLIHLESSEKEAVTDSYVKQLLLNSTHYILDNYLIHYETTTSHNGIRVLISLLTKEYYDFFDNVISNTKLLVSSLNDGIYGLDRIFPLVFENTPHHLIIISIFTHKVIFSWYVQAELTAIKDINTDEFDTDQDEFTHFLKDQLQEFEKQNNINFTTTLLILNHTDKEEEFYQKIFSNYEITNVRNPYLTDNKISSDYLIPLSLGLAPMVNPGFLSESHLNKSRYFRQKSLMQKWAVSVFSIVFVFYILMQGMGLFLARELSIMDKDYQTGKKILEQKNKTRTLNTQELADEKEIRKMYYSKIYFSKYLQEIGQKAPGVRLDNLEINNEKSFELIIKGKSDNLNMINQYLAELTQGKVFEKVDLVYTQVSTYGETKTQEFEIKCQGLK